MHTLYSNFKAILNSRHQRLLSTDPKETNVLTPGNFLIGQPLVCIPQPDNTASPQIVFRDGKCLAKPNLTFIK